MNRRPTSLLATPDRLAWTERRVLDKLTDAEGDQTALLDMLGDLALWFCRRPATLWATSTQEIVDALDQELHDTDLLSATIGAQVLTAVGEDLWSFADQDEMTWLAARRMALTDDAAGDFNLRMHGQMFEVMGQAVALTPDRDQAASMVNYLLQQEGPFEDLLQLGQLSAANAVCYGAPAHPDLRAYLVNHAVQWTNPGAPATHAVIGAALLGAELRDGGPLEQIVRDGIADRLAKFIAMEEEDGALQAALEWTLMAAVCQFEGKDDAAEILPGLFPNPQLVGLCVARAWTPGPARDVALKSLARLALLAEDPGFCRPLAHVESLGADGTGMMAQALHHALTEDAHPSANFAAYAACESIAQLPSLPNSIGDLLEQLVLGVVPPELRIVAGQALGAHRDALAPRFARVHDPLADLLGIDVVPTRAGAVGALLEIGNAAPTTASLAVMLVADGVPPQLLTGPLERGLRHGPGMVSGITDMLSHGAEQLYDACLMLLMGLAEALSTDVSLGPFVDEPPVHPDAKLALLIELLPHVGNLENPYRAGQTAIVCGWLGRGEEYVVDAILAARNAAPEDAKGIFDLALGAAGPIEKSIAHLGDLCAHAAPEVCANAAQALVVAADCFLDMDPIDDLLLTMRERIRYEGPQQGPLSEMIFQWCTLPAGFDPESPEVETLREMREELRKIEEGE